MKINVEAAPPTPSEIEGERSRASADEHAAGVRLRALTGLLILHVAVIGLTESFPDTLPQGWSLSGEGAFWLTFGAILFFIVAALPCWMKQSSAVRRLEFLGAVDPYDCVEVETFMHRYPEILAYVCAVQKQGRSLFAGEAEQIIEHALGRAADESFERARHACKTVHGIAR